MCLYVQEGCKPEIAKKDILCYKLVADHGGYWKPCIYIDGEKYSYPYNKVLTAETYSNSELHPINHLEVSWEMKNWIGCPIQRRKTIEGGFHAVCKKIYILANPCVIPKGTEYCLGEDDEIVAVNMIVFRSVLDYYWYRIKKLWQEKMQIVFNKNK